MEALVGLGGVVIGLLGGWLLQFANRRWQQQDKRQERSLQLTDKHREDLRHAYADYLAAFTQMLDVARSLLSTYKAFSFAVDERMHALVENSDPSDSPTDDEFRGQAERRIMKTALGEKTRDALNAIEAAQTALDVRENNLRLLEDDAARVSMLDESSKNPLKVTMYTEHEDFETAINEKTMELSALKHALAGQFSPKATVASLPHAPERKRLKK